MPIHRQFLPELPLQYMCITEELAKDEDNEQDTSSETASSSCCDFSDSSFNSLDIEEMTFKGTLKSSSSLPISDCFIDAWIEQTIPDYHLSRSRTRRRRRGRKSNPSKYARVKTRFYALEDERGRSEGFRKKYLQKTTIEEKKCLKTCKRFL